MRPFAALLFDIAYDEGGLPESVAFHAAWDSILFIVAAIAGQDLLPGKPANRQGAVLRGPAAFAPLFSTRS
jgi:hypothetical protein